MSAREEMHNLGQGIIASFEARSASIASLQEEVKGHRHAIQGQLGELDRNLRVTARQLRGELAKGSSDLRASVNAQLHGLGQGHTALTKVEARRKGELNTWLKEVDRTHRAMARQLRVYLAQERAALTPQETRRKAGVHAWIGQMAEEHAGARQEWQRLGVNIRGKRNGGTAVTEDLAALGDRVFQYLANHPDGTRLTEVEREFGLGRSRAGRVVRHLMDEGKAEKRDLAYFAT